MVKVKKICEQCGKEFEIPKFRSRIAQSYSKDCYHRFHTRKRVCKFCGKEFEIKLSLIKRGNGKFCSKECMDDWRKNRVKCVCERCKKEFWIPLSGIKLGRGKFCSRECKDKWQSENPDYHQFLRGIRKKQILKPTKPELIFQEICEKYNIPFHYVGDGQLWIGKRKKLNPDFIEANGKKILVEIMGSYWHSPLMNNNLRKDSLLSYRKRHYKHCNWIPIFIWDTDLLSDDAEQFVLSELRKGGAI